MHDAIQENVDKIKQKLFGRFLRFFFILLIIRLSDQQTAWFFLWKKLVYQARFERWHCNRQNADQKGDNHSNDDEKGLIFKDSKPL